MTAKDIEKKLEKGDRKRKNEFITNEGYCVKIIKVISKSRAVIEFEDQHNTTLEVDRNSLRKGEVRNPNHRSIFGIGFMGQGKHISSIKSVPTPMYGCWKMMISRCYDPKTQQKQPTYKDVTVCEEWHNFQNFGDWYEKNYVKGWQLDKDIICPDCKTYSPETCCFIPQEINLLFIIKVNKTGISGVKKNGKNYMTRIYKNGIQIHLGSFTSKEDAFNTYKFAKEAHVKEIAEKWKDKIDPRIYNAMINYEIS